MKPFTLEIRDDRCRPKEVRVALFPVEGVGEHRGRKLRAYEVYEVTERGRVLVGRVSEVTETLERRTKGKRHVDARWTGAKTRWTPFSMSLSRESRYARETRQDAIAVLFGMSRGKRVPEPKVPAGALFKLT